MPENCAAYCCKNRRTVQNRTRGITFHKFPKDRHARKKWEVALRREAFTASDSSVLCSEHFLQEDFDRTGQIVRLRAGATPSVFNFPAHLQTPAAAETSQPQMNLSEDSSQPVHNMEPPPVPGADHSYALPTSPNKLRIRLSEALVRVELLEREKRNSEDRERKSRNTIHKLLEDLKRKDLINAELEKQLDLCSDNIQHILSFL